MNKAIGEARKLYVDSNVIIYYIEGDEQHQKMADAFFEYVEANGIILMTSEITVGECLYGAYKRERADSIEKFNAIFEEVGIFHFVPVEMDIIKQAAKSGGWKKRLRMIDALHFASAIEAGCDALVTNDHDIHSTAHMKVIQLSAL
jgi:predicted nucleic acid-binding protein